VGSVTREVPVSRGRIAIVDDADFAAVMAAGPWHACRSDVGGWYARRHGRGGATWLWLHRFIVGTGPVDHINGDGLDNRRSSLRLATLSQNQGNQQRRRDNTSGFKGVSLHGQRWRAVISEHGRQRFLGSSDTAEEAARAYDAAALRYFGEFAVPNFPSKETAE
jgi:hypothetical protein